MTRAAGPERDEALPGRLSTALSDFEQAQRIRKLGAVVMRRRGFIAVATILIFVLASLAILLIPRQYTAEGSIQVDPRKTDVVNRNLPIDLEGIATEVEVLRSNSLASRVVARLAEQRAGVEPNERSELVGQNGWRRLVSPLAERISDIASDLREAVWGEHRAAPIPQTDTVDQSKAEQLLNNLSVVQQTHSRVIAVSYRSTDPGEAAGTVNMLLSTYLQDQVAIKQSATEEAHRWITGRLDRMRAQVRDAEYAVGEFRTQHRLFVGQDEIRPTVQELSDLNRRLVDARLRREQIDAHLSQVEHLLAAKADPAAINNVLQSQTITRLREQEALAARALAQSQETFGPKAPKVLELTAGLADAQKQIKLEVSRIIADMRGQAEQARREEAFTKSAISGVEMRIAAENEAGVALRDMEQQIAAQHQMLATFIDRAKETGAETSYQVPDARIVSFATVPTGPSRPKMPLSFYFAFAGALCTATCLALVRELLDDRLRDSEQIVSLGSVPLGMMPMIRDPRRLVHQCLAERPFSSLGESIRGLLTSLFMHSNDFPRVLAVTSSLLNEGKTTFVMNVARLMALAGLRVIVIDCDLHRSRLHHELGISQQVGLTEVLSGAIPAAVAIIHHQATGIDVILAGRAPRAHLLNIAGLRDVIEFVRPIYDLVIIDSGPVLVVSDARVIAYLADTTVLIARWAETRAAHAGLALQRLRQIRANVAGVFLTMVDAKKQSHYAPGIPAQHRHHVL
jgi:polysaccharide biosynthesis transport protein